jgi:hypothetical protein
VDGTWLGVDGARAVFPDAVAGNPRPATASPTAGWPVAGVGRLGVQRILVIEHDESIASLLRNGLTANGCTVEVVADGDAAVARVLSEDFDLVILDLGLPDGAAVGVARALQEVNATPSVLVVAKRDDLRDALTEPDR